MSSFFLVFTLNISGGNTYHNTDTKYLIRSTVLCTDVGLFQDKRYYHRLCLYILKLNKASEHTGGFMGR